MVPKIESLRAGISLASLSDLRSLERVHEVVEYLRDDIGSKGTHKGIRVILIPTVSESGVWKFKPFRVVYRGNAFKSHNKRVLNSF